MICHFRLLGTPDTDDPIATHVWPTPPDTGESVQLAGTWYIVAARGWTDVSDGRCTLWLVAQ